jgi:hypothetical protein
VGSSFPLSKPTLDFTDPSGNAKMVLNLRAWPACADFTERTSIFHRITRVIAAHSSTQELALFQSNRRSILRQSAGRTEDTRSLITKGFAMRDTEKDDPETKRQGQEVSANLH